MAITLGLLWWYLGQGARLEPILLFLALFGSLLGSQIRSRAGMVGIDTRAVGWVTRFERLALLVVGLFTNQLTLALLCLANCSRPLAVAMRSKMASSCASGTPLQ